jgi:hypothetical protein
MMNKFGCYIDSNVVTIDECSLRERNVKLLEKLPQPAALDHSMSHRPVFRLSTRTRIVLCHLDDQETRVSPRKTQ